MGRQVHSHTHTHTRSNAGCLFTMCQVEGNELNVSIFLYWKQDGQASVFIGCMFNTFLTFVSFQ